jgi:hypothetical protein
MKREVRLAGKGSKKERGRSPLSNSLPLSNNEKIKYIANNQFERGIKGVSIMNQTYSNRKLLP